MNGVDAVGKGCSCFFTQQYLTCTIQSGNVPGTRTSSVQHTLSRSFAVRPSKKLKQQPRNARRSRPLVRRRSLALAHSQTMTDHVDVTAAAAEQQQQQESASLITSISPPQEQSSSRHGGRQQSSSSSSRAAARAAAEHLGTCPPASSHPPGRWTFCTPLAFHPCRRGA